jgi:hypothetical protein
MSHHPATPSVASLPAADGSESTPFDSLTQDQQEDALASNSVPGWFTPLTEMDGYGLSILLDNYGFSQIVASLAVEARLRDMPSSAVYLRGFSRTTRELLGGAE